MCLYHAVSDRSTEATMLIRTTGDEIAVITAFSTEDGWRQRISSSQSLLRYLYRPFSKLLVEIVYTFLMSTTGAYISLDQTSEIRSIFKISPIKTHITSNTSTNELWPRCPRSSVLCSMQKLDSNTGPSCRWSSCVWLMRRDTTQAPILHGSSTTNCSSLFPQLYMWYDGSILSRNTQLLIRET